MFRKVGLIINQDKTEAVKMAQMAESFFSEYSIFTAYLQQDGSLAKDMDLIMTFGGDGTFLAGARFAMEYDIPLLGINLGTVGFLTEEEPGHLSECVWNAVLTVNHSVFLLRTE